MEVSIFPEPSVKKLKGEFIEARLHSDAVNPVFRERIAGLVRDIAKSKAQPIYVAMDPATETEINRFNGATLGDPEPFARFLGDMLDELEKRNGQARKVADPVH